MAEAKGNASQALAQALQEKVFFFFLNTYFLASFSFSHSPPLLFCWCGLCAFHVCVCVFFFFFLTYGILSGCSIVAFITAGRKTITGEKCECSSSKENGGTPEKLITGNFSVCFWHFSSMILKVCCLEGVLTLFVCIITKLMKKFMWFLEEIFEWMGDFWKHIIIMRFYYLIIGSSFILMYYFLIFSSFLHVGVLASSD